MPVWFILLTQFSIIALALIGGVFLAFSDFIMRSLAITRAPGGIEVMQAINREVFRWVFMTLFLGMAAVSLAMAAYALLHLDGQAAVLILLGAATYLLGVFGVTVVFNVPLNTLLDGMASDTAATQAFWTARYLPDWTFWNSVRTAGSVLAAGLYLVAVVRLAAA